MTDDVTLFVCLHSVCYCCYHSLKLKKSKRVICQILVASRAEILASFRTLNFARIVVDPPR